MHYAFCSDGRLISSPPAIKLRKMASGFNAIQRLKITLTDTMQILLRYARAFQEDYSVWLVDMRLVHLVENMMSSNFLAADYGGTYMRYIIVFGIMLKHRGDLRLLSEQHGRYRQRRLLASHTLMDQARTFKLRRTSSSLFSPLKCSSKNAKGQLYSRRSSPTYSTGRFLVSFTFDTSHRVNSRFEHLRCFLYIKIQQTKIKSHSIIFILQHYKYSRPRLIKPEKLESKPDIPKKRIMLKRENQFRSAGNVNKLEILFFVQCY